MEVKISSIFQLHVEIIRSEIHYQSSLTVRTNSKNEQR